MEEHFYSFMAQPGEVAVTLDMKPLSESGIGFVDVELMNSDGESLLKISSRASGMEGSTRKVGRLQITRPQQITMRILGEFGSNEGSASYRVRVSGAVRLSSSQARIVGETSSVNLPSKGVLRLELDDGTVREIDLSHVRKAVTQ